MGLLVDGEILLKNITAMNSLFAGTANAAETVGNGVGGIFGGLFGGKKKKNPDAADLPAGVGGKDILSGLNKETSASAALGDSSKTEKTEVSGHTEVTVHIKQDGQPDQEVQTVAPLKADKARARKYNKYHGDTYAYNDGQRSGVKGIK